MQAPSNIPIMLHTFQRQNAITNAHGEAHMWQTFESLTHDG